MPRYVALLRGINVGRAKRVAMADLRALLGSLGYDGVRTLLNSGNAVFDGSQALQSWHARRIQEAIAAELHVESLVIVKSAEQMAGVVAGNALATVATDPSRLLVALTTDSNSLAVLEPYAKRDWGAERVRIGEHAAYVWCANGILDSKLLGELLKCLGPVGTTRNWATIGKIHAMLQDSGH